MQTTEFSISDNGCLYFRNRLYMPNDSEVKQNILHEDQSSVYSIHLVGESRTLASVRFVTPCYDSRMKMRALPLSSKKRDAICVIFDILTKLAHFIVIKIYYSLEKLIELYVFEIVRLHSVLLSIISYRDLSVHTLGVSTPGGDKRTVRMSDSSTRGHLNLLIITTTNWELKWHRSRLYMDENAELHCTGLN
ncbi:integrase [Gossypium australe]|uniref:Integrase n=1 Tax=Gossypium australe TaxID=47621 RepID=A0A5B6VV85_9ROSI|nr:integrase [Gossypium australe]